MGKKLVISIPRISTLGNFVDETNEGCMYSISAVVDEEDVEETVKKYRDTTNSVNVYDYIEDYEGLDFLDEEDEEEDDDEDFEDEDLENLTEEDLDKEEDEEEEEEKDPYEVYEESLEQFKITRKLDNAIFYIDLLDEEHGKLFCELHNFGEYEIKKIEEDDNDFTLESFSRVVVRKSDFCQKCPMEDCRYCRYLFKENAALVYTPSGIYEMCKDCIPEFVMMWGIADSTSYEKMDKKGETKLVKFVPKDFKITEKKFLSKRNMLW